MTGVQTCALPIFDRKPILASGVDATAAIAYLTGYAQMLRGELAPAKSQFSAAIGRDRFINEAVQALALIQAHEGNGQQGKETYLASLWRFKPKQLVFCGAQGTKADEQARPPIDEVFDTSMGKPGELVHFWHPARTDDLRRWDKDIGDLLTERGAIMQKAAARMQALAPKVNLSQSRTPDDAYNEKMTLLLEGLDEQEPYVVKLMKAEEAVRTKTEASVGQAGEVYGRENMKFAMSPTRNICPLQRAAATRGIQAVGGPAKELELAMRRTARDWYKMATGLNAKIGDKDWHEYNQASLTVQLETLNVLLLESMNASYGHFGADTDCQEDIPDQPLTGQAVAGGTPCDTILGNMKFKHSFEIPDVPNGPKFSFEVGCDKMKADIQYDLLKAKGGGFGTGLGGIAQVEIGRKGDYTVFAGAKADVSGPLASGSIRSGFYAKGDSSGLKELGGRFEMGSKLGPKGMQRESKERMDFNILPTPPAGERGPALRAFRPPP